MPQHPLSVPIHKAPHVLPRHTNQPSVNIDPHDPLWSVPPRDGQSHVTDITADVQHFLAGEQPLRQAVEPRVPLPAAAVRVAVAVVAVVVAVDELLVGRSEVFGRSALLLLRRVALGL